MKKKQFSFKSTNGIDKIYSVEWICENNPKAIIIIVPGICDNINRYQELANFLTTKGFIVCGLDTLSHGRSSNIKNKKLSAKNFTWRNIVMDIHKLNIIEKKKNPNLPIYAIGFNISNDYLKSDMIMNKYDFNKVIFIGDNYYSLPVLLVEFIKLKIVTKLNKEKFNRKVINSILFKKYNSHYAKNCNIFSFMNNEKEEVNKFINDPLNKTIITPKYYLEVNKARLYNYFNINKINKLIKILFLSGDKDPVSSYAIGVDKIKGKYYKYDILNTKIKLFKGLRHDILNTYARKEIYEYIYNWIIES